MKSWKPEGLGGTVIDADFVWDLVRNAGFGDNGSFDGLLSNKM